jgi:hypothetical protein
MRTKTVFTISLILITQLVFSQIILQRKTNWTVAEAKKWSETYKDFPTWDGLLLYQGSDTAMHHYIARIVDDFFWFNIKKTELTVNEERQYQTTSSASFGYYYVDAAKDFIKIKDR